MKKFFDPLSCFIAGMIILGICALCQRDDTDAAQANRTITLVWTNPVTWCANLVEYRNALSEPWRFYTLFTNSNALASAITITRTNAQQFYRVACVYYFE